jgi:hypothetical protein
MCESRYIDIQNKIYSIMCNSGYIDNQNKTCSTMCDGLFSTTKTVPEKD